MRFFDVDGTVCPDGIDCADCVFENGSTNKITSHPRTYVDKRGGIIRQAGDTFFLIASTVLRVCGLVAISFSIFRHADMTVV